MLIQGEHYNFTVIKILDRGAVGTIDGETRTGFVHISCIAECFVSQIADFVSVGESYDAVCTDADKYGFTLKHLNLKKKQGESTAPVKKEIKRYDSRPAQDDHAKKPYSKPKVYESLDEMIAHADRSLKDKQKSRHNDKVKQRRHHNKQNSDID